MLMKTPPTLQATLKQYQKQLTYSLEIITPERAQELLDSFNRKNRPLREGLARKYASRMALKKWKVDGRTVVIDIDNQMVNGQHRCRAIVMSKTAIITLVVRGVDPDARDTTDDFGPRTSTDTMQRLQIPNPRPTATAAQVVLRYRNGTSRAAPKVANSEVAEFMGMTPEFEGWVARGNVGQRSTVRKSIPLVIAVSYLASATYPAEAASFLSSFSTGANLPARSPILALRNRYESDRRMRSHERVALAIQAWNAYVEGRSMGKMQLYKGDNFPTIVGAAKVARR